MLSNFAIDVISENIITFSHVKGQEKSELKAHFLV